MKLFYNLILLILLIGSVSASLGTFKQNDCIQIKTILNATWVNISTISIPPNNTIYVSNKAMTKIGQTFYYNFCNTSELGTYIYDYWDNTGEVYVNDFIVTSTGNDRINTGESMNILIGLLIIMGLSAGFIYLGVKSEMNALKIIFIGSGAILIIALVLFVMVLLSQTITSYKDIVEGYSTIWFILKVFIGIALVGLLVYVLIISYNYWLYRRGFKD